MNSFSFRKTLALAALLLAISSPWAAERALLANPAGETLPFLNPVTKSVAVNLVTQSLTLRSAAFLNGGVIPNEFTYNFSGQCSGNNWSPPFDIENIPFGTKSLAIVLTDPDGGDWLHWKAWNIPASTISLSYNSSTNATYSQTFNDFGTSGYGGPCPPSPNHHYNFTLYALNTTFSSSPTTVQLEGAAIATAILQGIRSPTDDLSWTPPIAQTIVFGAVPTIVVGGTGILNAIGGASGQPVIFSSSTPTFCTVSSNTVAGIAVGTCTIAANQAGNVSYSSAPQITQNISIFPAPTYALTVTSSGTANVAIAATPSTYAGVTPYNKSSITAGTSITLAAPVSTGGARFDSWNGCGSATGINCTVTMNAAKSVMANYTINTYAITTTASPLVGGAVVCTPNPVNSGSSSICTATPNTGYSFRGWSGDCTISSCTLSNVTAAKNVTASFAANSTSNLTASPGSPALPSQTTTLTAQVGGALGTPTGNVLFKEDGTLLGTVALNNGVATYSAGIFSIGTHNLSASYVGDATYLSSLSNLSYRVANTIDTLLTVRTMPNLSQPGENVPVTVIITPLSNVGTVSGSVEISSDGQSCRIILPAASCTLMFSTKGTKRLSAAYSGNNFYTAGTGSGTHFVGQRVGLTPILMLLLD